MKTEKFNITYEQYGRLMVFEPAWLFKVMYSDLTPEEILSYASDEDPLVGGICPHPTFIFDNAEQASECFVVSIFHKVYDQSLCGFVEDEYEQPWSLTYHFTSFRVNGKGFNVHWGCKDPEKDFIEIEYAHPQIPWKEGDSIIEHHLKNSKLEKKLEVDLSEPRYRIKKQICDWLTNETFEDIPEEPTGAILPDGGLESLYDKMVEQGIVKDIKD